MVDPAIADCQCYGCERYLMNPNTHKSSLVKDDPIIAFRCLYCGRMFCNNCAEEHFE